MFGVSIWELLVVLLLVVIVVGPDKLPEVARSLGRSFGKVKKSLDEVKEEVGLDEEMDLLRDVRDLPEAILAEVSPQETDEDGRKPPQGPKPGRLKGGRKKVRAGRVQEHGRDRPDEQQEP